MHATTSPQCELRTESEEEPTIGNQSQFGHHAQVDHAQVHMNIMVGSIARSTDRIVPMKGASAPQQLQPQAESLHRSFPVPEAQHHGKLVTLSAEHLRTGTLVQREVECPCRDTPIELGEVGGTQANEHTGQWSAHQGGVTGDERHECLPYCHPLNDPYFRRPFPSC